MSYSVIIEGIECTFIGSIKTGLKFYEETKTGYNIYLKTKKRVKFIEHVNRFGELYEKANNEMPHSNCIYLNP